MLFLLLATTFLKNTSHIAPIRKNVVVNHCGLKENDYLCSKDLEHG